eukprot:TRINITY_DN78787_c0_g1_i1.p1 TRINITY_DN78787_c0_g1~~TRINITY_DN78787_c0_g1_i1.p1  ORF type:complete len:351 (+),score=56.96 TRINITY_DN78787_c0_g1_i1:104-1156(+)
MDFDDLDEEIDRRLADGEAVACQGRENNQPIKGTLLPLVQRTNRLPSTSQLPHRARQQLPPFNGEKEKLRKPVLRLLCIHGAADSYGQDWHLFAEDAPEEIEVAIHEFPGHGHRAEEPFLTTLQELSDDAFEAFRESMDTGAFALLGHSIGCLMTLCVAKRAREQLGVEPVLVVMMERGAAQHPLLTESGADLLRRTPEIFFESWNPTVHMLHKKSGELGRRTLEMWAKDQIIEQETLQVGWHRFCCPMLILPADASLDTWVRTEELDEEKQKLVMKNIEIGAYRQTHADGRTFCGHFPLWTFDGWTDWTEHPSGCQITVCQDTDHMNIKNCKAAKDEIWKALQSAIDRF